MWRKYRKRKGVIDHVKCCLSFKLYTWELTSGFSKVEVIRCSSALLENSLSYLQNSLQISSTSSHSQLMTCYLFQYENRNRKGFRQSHLCLCPECTLSPVTWRDSLRSQLRQAICLGKIPSPPDYPWIPFQQYSLPASVFSPYFITVIGIQISGSKFVGQVSMYFFFFFFWVCTS